MARLKRTSVILEAARQRLAGLRSITPPPDFAEGLKISDYEREVNDFTNELDSYNERLSGLDQTQNDLDASENRLREKNRRILAATEATYGPDSNEYEQVGGTRTSDRKRPGSKGTGPTNPSTPSKPDV